MVTNIFIKSYEVLTNKVRKSLRGLLIQRFNYSFLSIRHNRMEKDFLHIILEKYLLTHYVAI